jgi:peptide/nickel transport system ATP-binding protein
VNKLETRALKVRYGVGRRALIAVDGVDIAIPTGGTLGLVGESGCGKSTIARAIVGLVPLVGGRVLLDGVDHTSQGARNSSAYRRKVQMVFQDPYSSLNPRMTVQETLGEALRIRGVRKNIVAAESARMLELVGLSPKVLIRYPHQFSGGQRQRLAIARALAVGPQLIISDEITSALDVSVQATILNLLKELQRELGLSYLFISHDLSVVRYMSDHVAVMYLGRVVESAPVDELFAQPHHPYTRGLMASIPQFHADRIKALIVGDLPDPRNPPRGCRFHTRCQIGPIVNPERTICLSADPSESATQREHLAACHFSAALATRPITAALPVVD